MVVRRIRAESGIFGFWKGLTASWWGISETVIHFVIYEFLKKSLAEHQNKKKDENMTLLDFIGSMACGATSKTCATCVAYPHGECLLLQGDFEVVFKGELKEVFFQGGLHTNCLKVASRKLRVKLLQVVFIC